MPSIILGLHFESELGEYFEKVNEYEVNEYDCVVLFELIFHLYLTIIHCPSSCFTFRYMRGIIDPVHTTSGPGSE